MAHNGNARTDWKEIQEYFDSGHSENEVCKIFKTSTSTLWRAAKRGDLKRRTRSEASILGHERFERKHTDETKQKLSKIRIDFLKQNPDKVPYLLNHSSKGDSYPERYFTELFDKENIILLKKHQIGLYQLDFCDINKKLYVEIDGEQHYVDEKIVASDIRRTGFLEENGWKGFRVRWADYQRMSFDSRKMLIERIRCFLQN